MFTGIVQALGTVRSFSGSELLVTCPPIDDDPWKIGESIAVNGCCLTLASFREAELSFDLSEETIQRTAFRSLKAGSTVNVERAMKMGGRFGGHWVQGHVDAVGVLKSVNEIPQSHTLSFQVPEGSGQYLVDKGSITIDGVSLTVIEPSGGSFKIAVIPYTWEHTNLSRLVASSAVNVEFDVLAKYVERFTSSG